jgi:enoyl-CoA hydratase/carnithine racemase
MAMAVDLAACSAKTLAIGKTTLYQQVEMNLAEAYAFASRAMVDNLLLPDAGEGVSAFLEKRSPQWEG